MLTINSNPQCQTNVNFGTALKVDEKLLEKIPETSYIYRKIDEFREFLAKDGKNWTAELNEDCYSKTNELTDSQIKNLLSPIDDGSKESKLAIRDLLPKMKNVKERDNIIETYINKSLTEDSLFFSDVTNSKTAMELIGLHSNQSTIIELIKKAVVRGSKWHTLDDLAYSAGKQVGEIKDPNKRQEIIEMIKKSDKFDFASSQRGLLSSEKLDDEELIPLIKHFTAQGGTYNGYNDCWDKGGIINAIFRLHDTKMQEDLIRDLAANERTKNIIPDILSSDKITNPDLFDKLMDNCIKKTLCGNYKINSYDSVSNILGKINDVDKAIFYIKDCTNKSSFLHENNQYYAAMSAGFIKDSKQAAKLIGELLQSENAEVRNGAAIGIGKISDSKIAAELIKKYKNHSDERVIKNAIGSITDFNDMNVAKSLVAELENDTNPNVKKAISLLKDNFIYQSKLEDPVNIDGYNLKITDGDKLVGEYNHKENDPYISTSDIFKYIYEVIVEAMKK